MNELLVECYYEIIMFFFSEFTINAQIIKN